MKQFLLLEEIRNIIGEQYIDPASMDINHIRIQRIEDEKVVRVAGGPNVMFNSNV